MQSIDTLAKLKAEGYRLWGHCGAPNCGHADILPIDTLIEKFGADYCFINGKRIAASIVCQKCGHKGGMVTLDPQTRPR